MMLLLGLFADKRWHNGLLMIFLHRLRHFCLFLAQELLNHLKQKILLNHMVVNWFVRRIRVVDINQNVVYQGSTGRIRALLGSLMHFPHFFLERFLWLLAVVSKRTVIVHIDQDGFLFVDEITFQVVFFYSDLHDKTWKKLLCFLDVFVLVYHLFVRLDVPLLVIK